MEENPKTALTMLNIGLLTGSGKGKGYEKTPKEGYEIVSFSPLSPCFHTVAEAGMGRKLRCVPGYGPQVFQKSLHDIPVHQFKILHRLLPPTQSIGRVGGLHTPLQMEGSQKEIRCSKLLTSLSMRSARTRYLSCSGRLIAAELATVSNFWMEDIG